LQTLLFSNPRDVLGPGNPPKQEGENCPLSEKKDPMGQNRIKIDLLIHDLKVPLAVIEAGITSLLNRQEKYGLLTEKQIKVLQRALRNTKITQNLVGDALELSRSNQGMMHLTDVRICNLFEDELIEIFDLANSKISERIRGSQDLEGLKIILQAEGLRLDIEKSLWGGNFRLDEGKLKQILRNLLINALKYRKSSIELRVFLEAGALLICVKDDGEGIPAEYHRKIFDCYFQLDPSDTCSVRGHGLGLAGVMVLLEDMGGKMTLSSGEGQGAEFMVSIPLPANEASC
jgi:two-component system OmpR family sensor kinase